MSRNRHQMDCPMRTGGDCCTCFFDEAEMFYPKRRVLTSGNFKSMPIIVCLCGSTRFYREFQRANYEETMAGRIVLSVGFFMHSADQAHSESLGCTPEQKLALDELHKRKIDLADEVLILNVRGYIGTSTRSELEYARSLGKRVRFLEQESPGFIEGGV